MGTFKVVKLVGSPVTLQFTGGVTPKGAYNGSTPYSTGDSVSYLGASYVAIQSTTGNLPTDTSFWQLLADKGEPGNPGTPGTDGADSVVPGPPGPGVVAGGSTGQSLRKKTNADYDTEWATPAGGGDMLKATYDPSSKVADAFNVDNHADGTTNKVYPATDKSKLAGIESGAQVNVNPPDQAVNQASTPTFADAILTGMTGLIFGAIAYVKAAIQALDDSLYSFKSSGFGAWTSGADGATYTITGGKFQIDRDGYGYILGKKYTWSSGLQTDALTANATSWIYMDTDGVLKASTSYVSNKIMLYEVLYDGTNYFVKKENHPKEFLSALSGYAHNVISNVLYGSGGNITRVATGTGAAPEDRQLKIVGAATLSDHGLNTTINDSGGVAVTFSEFIRNGSGQWIRDSVGTGLSIKYNNSGTPAALDITNAFAIKQICVAKDDIESASPQYIAVMDEAVFTTLLDAQNAIASGSFVIPSNELSSLELARLGYIVVAYSATGGYIAYVSISKDALNTLSVGGGASNDYNLLTNKPTLGTAAATASTDYAPAAKGVTGGDAHAGRHVTGGGDVIAAAVAAGNAGLMTGADKTKLDGVATGANVGVVPNAGITGAQKTKITYDAKGLVTAGTDATQDDVGDGTTNKQYSSAEKTKLAGIASGAQVNNISDVNATDLTDGGATTLHSHAGGAGISIGKAISIGRVNYIY